MFVEGAPDDLGQLTHHGFCSIFGLRTDEYTDRLVWAWTGLGSGWRGVEGEGLKGEG
jgi:hypothetical protein